MKLTRDPQGAQSWKKFCPNDLGPKDSPPSCRSFHVLPAAVTPKVAAPECTKGTRTAHSTWAEPSLPSGHPLPRGAHTAPDRSPAGMTRPRSPRLTLAPGDRAACRVTTVAQETLFPTTPYSVPGWGAGHLGEEDSPGKRGTKAGRRTLRHATTTSSTSRAPWRPLSVTSPAAPRPDTAGPTGGRRSRRAGGAAHSPSELWPRSPAERSLLGAPAPPPSWSLFNDAPCAAFWERAPRPANRRSDPGAPRAPGGRRTRGRRRRGGFRAAGLAAGSWAAGMEKSVSRPPRRGSGARTAAPAETRAAGPDGDGRAERAPAAPGPRMRAVRRRGLSAPPPGSPGPARFPPPRPLPAPIAR